MRCVPLLLSLSLLAPLAGCRERPTNRDDDGVSVGKPVEHDDDFIQTRTSFETNARERLDRLSTRIEELGSDANAHLRAERDALAKRLDGTDEQLEAGWDRFEAETRGALERLELEVDRAVD